LSFCIPLIDQKAADQGYAKAQSNLGIAYAFGKGVLKDDKKAVYWYQKAADQGQAKTQFNLGVKYAFGKGVLKDDKQAVYWYPPDQPLFDTNTRIAYRLLTPLCQNHT
jgi:hypothetical protein